MCAFLNDCLIDAIDAELNSAVNELKHKKLTVNDAAIHVGAGAPPAQPGTAQRSNPLPNPASSARITLT
jgi:hypothetical protein